MTVRWLGAEAIVDAAVAKLRTNMPVRIAAINTEKDDDITLTFPDDDRYYTAMRRVVAPGSPAIIVMEGPMTVVGADGPHSLETLTKLGVWVMDEDVDEERLADRLRRLSRAAVESLWDADPAEQLHDDDGNQVAWRIAPSGEETSPIFELESGGADLREFKLTVFNVQRREGD